jgi:hypothetical protein
MKNRYKAGFFGLCVLLSFTANSQEAIAVKQHIPDKPFIFSQFPQRSDCITNELFALFKSVAPSKISLTLPGGRKLNGTISEKVLRNPAVTSINIKLDEYPGALFSLSLIEEPGRPQKLVGRIIHPQSGDLLELVQENQSFYFEKKIQKYFMTE